MDSAYALARISSWPRKRQRRALITTNIPVDIALPCLSSPPRQPIPRILPNMLPSNPEPTTAVKPITKLLLLTALIVLGNSLLLAADRGVLVREAVIYLSPDTSSSKLGQVERGRELVLLDKSRNWLHVEALLGFAQTPDPAFVEDEDVEGKTISGWVFDTGVVWASTPNGDRILFGAAVDSEDEAGRRRGRRGAAQDALRLYPRVSDLSPAAPLAGEALYRAADIKWQIDKADMQSRPSAREKENYLRSGIDEESMKQVIKKFPNTKWAQLAAFHLIDNKLCGDWQGSSKCPEKEADIYEKYVKEHPKSPAAPEALYNAASRRAALIENYKAEEQSKKSEQSKSSAMALAQQLISHHPQSYWLSRGQTLLLLLQQGVPTYGNAMQKDIGAVTRDLKCHLPSDNLRRFLNSSHFFSSIVTDSRKRSAIRSARSWRGGSRRERAMPGSVRINGVGGQGLKDSVSLANGSDRSVSHCGDLEVRSTIQAEHASHQLHVVERERERERERIGNISTDCQEQNWELTR